VLFRSYKEQDIATLTEDLSKYEYLEKAETDLEVLENMEIRRNTSANRSYKLRLQIDDLYEIERIIDEESKVLVYEKAVTDILADIDERAKQDLEEVKLDRLVSDIKVVKEELLQSQLICIYEKTVNDLIKLYADKETQNTNKIKLSKALRLISDTDRQIKNAGALQVSLQSQFDREFPNICPLCGKPK
jgi:hypothetical protein